VNKNPAKIEFELILISTFKNIEGQSVDMYQLHYDPFSETGISLVVSLVVSCWVIL
jgi:hypothetical protein